MGKEGSEMGEVKSDMGEVKREKLPDGWKMQSLKVLFKIFSGTTPKTNIPEFWDGDIIWITPADFKTDDVFIDSGSRNITEFGRKSCSLEIVPKNSLIFSKRAPIGKVCINLNEVCINQGCIACVPKTKLNIKWFYYLLSVLTEEFEVFGSGTTFKEISLSNFMNFKIPVPPFTFDFSLEQPLTSHFSLLTFLDRQCAQIDAVLTKTKQSIEEYKKLKNAIITHAVTKGIRQNRNFKYSNIQWIGDIPKEWEVGKIFYCFNLIGSGTTPTSNREDYYSGDINWLQSGDINGNIVNETSKTITQTALNDFQTLKIYKSPFLVIAMYGASIANTSIVNIDCTTNQACCVLSEPKNNINLKFAFYMILASKNELLLASRGGTQPNISQEIIKNYRLPLPPLAEQHRIVARLNELLPLCDTLEEAR